MYKLTSLLTGTKTNYNKKKRDLSQNIKSYVPEAVLIL